jgi:GTP:adenosylcobinamide-phosphate guanylyltransferase
MDAVLMAGGIPQPDDPLYAYSQGESKALIDIAGRPMIQWVVDALNDAKSVDHIVVVGLSEKAALTSRKPVAYLSNEGRLLENLKSGTARAMELNPRGKYVMFVSSDIPSVTGPMVDWVVDTCMQTKHDLYYNVIERKAMEATFPESRRTYTRLKDLELCGGDLNVARAAIVNENSDFWTKLLEARKNPAAQAGLIGGDIIIKFLFRRLTIQDVIDRVAAKLGIRGRAIICPYPEIGMDVDKPHQLEIMRDFLGRRSGRLTPRGRWATKPARKSRTVPAKGRARSSRK